VDDLVSSAMKWNESYIKQFSSSSVSVGPRGSVRKRVPKVLYMKSPELVFKPGRSKKVTESYAEMNEIADWFLDTENR
mgnify:CR=1